MNFTKNISKTFSMFGKLRKLDIWATHRVITNFIVAPSTSWKKNVGNNVEIASCLKKNIAQAYQI